MSRRPILLLANPEAGAKPGSPPSIASHDAASEPEDLAAALRGRGVEVSLHVLSPDDDAGDLAKRAADAGNDIVVAGGDGTVGAAASALLHHPDAALGILATGSFNNIARGFGVPVDLDPALDAIARGQAIAMDAGRVHRDDPKAGRAFFEACGVGLDAMGFLTLRVAERRGVWAAARAAWRGLRRRRTRMTLTLDGDTFSVRAPAVIVSNGPFFGLGFAVAPDADPTDGSFDVVVMRRMTTFQVLRYLLAVARHRTRREPRVMVRRARKVTIEGARRALPAHADGELIGVTPVLCQVDERALRVFR